MIRTKLTLSYIVIILLLNGIAFFLYHSSQNEKQGYEAILQNFFLLNEIYSDTIKSSQTLNAYLLNKSMTPLEEYRINIQDLNRKKEELSNTYRNENNYLTIENYRNMIQSFIGESDMAINQYASSNYDLYYSHLTEAEKISNFIQQTTLQLINKELTDYNLFYGKMEQKSRYSSYMSISLFISTLLIGVLIALRFSRSIARPILQLTAAAREIARGILDGKEIRVQSKDEFSFLASTFNHMRSNISSLVEEMKEKSELESLLKQMELRNLQNQIKPHFLFNTLNIVSKMAYLEGAERTSELVDSVSSLLRYNLGAMDRTATLREEMQIIQDYLYIQQTRFGKRLTVRTSIDESCLDIAVPPLSLQPIVENAFVHGIEAYEEGAMLAVNVFARGDTVIVEIADNGKGMEEAEVRRILSMEAAETENAADPDMERKKPDPGSHTRGIGMENVIRRLSLYYQRVQVVEIESSRGVGTTVRLLLPIKSGEDLS